MRCRRFSPRSTLALLALAIASAPTLARADDPPATPASLKPTAFTPLPLGQVKPAGWLRDQLRLQADGLSGHLHEFWPDIRNSAWIGGTAEGWERVPYWLDGVVPLAFLLDDPNLKAQTAGFINYILQTQKPDGWLGPLGDNDKGHRPYDPWPLFPLLKALTQYGDATADPRVFPAVYRACKRIDQVITETPLYSWAKFRAADLAVTLDWLYARNPEPWILALRAKALTQAHDWLDAYGDNFSYTGKSPENGGLKVHGVNTGMGLKFGPVRWRLSGKDSDRDGAILMLDKLDQYHGQATGLFTCDELIAGRNPSQGSELCTVVEAMYSLALGTAITGDARLADRMDRLAFNALPATFKKDMTAHQYDQQTNQVVCKVSEERVYVNNGPDANLYGLEPHFGCCTANFHQGWPKFAAHQWMASADGGLAAISYAPSVGVAVIQGQTVQFAVDSEYPFRDTATIKITTPVAMAFPLHLRIPSWAEGAEVSFRSQDPGRLVTVRTGDEVAASKAVEPAIVVREKIDNPGRFARFDAQWTPGTTLVTVRLPAKISLWKGYNDAVAINRGPLTFALDIPGEWKVVRDRPEHVYDDWEVAPRSDWNYAIAIDRDDPSKSITFEDRPVGPRPFSPEGAPIVAKVKGRKLPGWGLEKNAAAPPPQSPVTSDEPERTLTFLPYGCTDLRLTELPVLKTDD